MPLYPFRVDRDYDYHQQSFYGSLVVGRYFLEFQKKQNKWIPPASPGVPGNYDTSTIGGHTFCLAARDASHAGTIKDKIEVNILSEEHPDNKRSGDIVLMCGKSLESFVFDDTYFDHYNPKITKRHYPYVNSQVVTYQIKVNGEVDGEYRTQVNPLLTGEIQEVTPFNIKIKLPESFKGVTENIIDLKLPPHIENGSRYNYSVKELIQHLLEHTTYSEENKTKLRWIAINYSCFPSQAGILKFKPLLNQMERDPLLAFFLDRFSSYRSSAGIIPNRLLTAFFKHCNSDITKVKEEILKTTENFWDHQVVFRYRYNDASVANEFLSCLPGAFELLELEGKKRDWRKRTTNSEKAQGLLEDPTLYPVLYETLAEGNLPFGVFSEVSRAGTEGEPVNREFDLWEEALSQKDWKDIVLQAAQNASRRTTYERTVTPWLMFMLYQLPEYLNSHAPRADGSSWRCVPKFVQSTWVAEMDENATGTVKRRSAMTPVADNETGIVSVPFVAIATYGGNTTWCYSRFYNVFRKGFYDTHSKTVITKDLEEKLNGRDDYGIMHYILDGSSTVQGYPTFLIIFERKTSETVVHFHRVHPCRIKDGVFTNGNKLIQACYQYMAGNVPASDITAQQGDIILLRRTSSEDKDSFKYGIKDDIETVEKVSRFVFESHEFVGPLEFYPSTSKSKSNRLGFIWAPSGLQVLHPEHEDVKDLGPGWYEIRRAKSYENNPTSSMSFFHD